MFWQKATALFIGFGSVALIIPLSPKICFESAFTQPINLLASSLVISLLPSDIIFWTAGGTSLSLKVSIKTL